MLRFILCGVPFGPDGMASDQGNMQLEERRRMGWDICLGGEEHFCRAHWS